MTLNQEKLLRALCAKGAVLHNVWNDGATPTYVYVPGLARPVTEFAKQTVRACIKRGWLIGSPNDGYRISSDGTFYLSELAKK